MIFIQLIISIGTIVVYDPKLLVPIIFMVISIFGPLIIWFIRNFTRIVLKRNIDWLNFSLKWFFLGGFILFLISLILIVLAAIGVY